MLKYALQEAETMILHTAFDGGIVLPKQWVIMVYIADIQLKPNGSTKRSTKLKSKLSI